MGGRSGATGALGWATLRAIAPLRLCATTATSLDTLPVTALLAVELADVVAADTAAGRRRATTAGWRVTFLATAPIPPLATASLAAEDVGRTASTAARPTTLPVT